MAVADFNELQLRQFVREEMDRSRLAVLTRQGQGDQQSLGASLSSITSRVTVLEGHEPARGKANIPAAEVRTNTAYGLMTTPDQVAGIVLPTDGLIVVAYQALFRSSVAGAGSAAIFVGANQLRVQDTPNRAPVGQAAVTSGTFYDPLATFGGGLVAGNATAGDHNSDVTTGQLVGLNTTVAFGGLTAIFAAAGTYALSVQFKATSGSVTAKERRLWVWSMGF